MARELGDPLLILLLWFIGALFAIGAAMSANMVLLGDKLGLYKSMAKMGMVILVELAKATKTTKRDVREWLAIRPPEGMSLTTLPLAATRFLRNRRWRPAIGRQPHRGERAEWAA